MNALNAFVLEHLVKVGGFLAGGPESLLRLVGIDREFCKASRGVPEINAVIWWLRVHAVLSLVI